MMKMKLRGHIIISTSEMLATFGLPAVLRKDGEGSGPRVRWTVEFVGGVVAHVLDHDNEGRPIEALERFGVESASPKALKMLGDMLRKSVFPLSRRADRFTWGAGDFTMEKA